MNGRNRTWFCGSYFGLRLPRGRRAIRRQRRQRIRHRTVNLRSRLYRGEVTHPPKRLTPASPRLQLSGDLFRVRPWPNSPGAPPALAFLRLQPARPAPAQRPRLPSRESRSRSTANSTNSFPPPRRASARCSVPPRPATDRLCLQSPSIFHLADAVTAKLPATPWPRSTTPSGRPPRLPADRSAARPTGPMGGPAVPK